MSVLRSSHPSRRRLAEWLRSVDAEADPAIGDHVEGCETCAERLDELATKVVATAELTPDDDLADAIREVYAPPDDLVRRVIEHVDERQRAEQEFSLFVGLFGIAADAADLMMGGGARRVPPAVPAPPAEGEEPA